LPAQRARARRLSRSAPSPASRPSATPQLRIFYINPDVDHDNYGSIFPSDFIVSLGMPPNYFGQCAYRASSPTALASVDDPYEAYEIRLIARLWGTGGHDGADRSPQQRGKPVKDRGEAEFETVQWC
jgi:hypothetical protein